MNDPLLGIKPSQCRKSSKELSNIQTKLTSNICGITPTGKKIM